MTSEGRRTRRSGAPGLRAAVVAAAVAALVAAVVGPTAAAQDPGADADGPDILELRAGEPDPGRVPGDPPDPRPTLVAARHVLIAHRDARRAPPAVVRTEEQARTIAGRVAAVARSRGVDFTDVARTWSDGPSAPQGGLLGVFPRGRMVPAFERAVFDLEVGRVSDPVQTEFGWHVIQRIPIEEAGERAVRHVLVKVAGARTAPPDLERTDEEARDLARRVHALLTEEGRPWEDVAAEYGEDSRARDDGYLGIFTPGTLPEPLDDALQSLDMHGISEPVRGELGWHVLQRVPVRRARARHILVMHADSERPRPGVERTAEQARDIAERLRVRVAEEDADFAAVAREHSDDVTAPEGGMIGWVEEARVPEPFFEALWTLEPGGISPVVETEFGFHVIQRIE